MELQPFQQRVIDERDDLEIKASKLQDFILSDKFSSVPADERQRLVLQRNLMVAYVIVLDQRIAAFGG